MPAVRKQLILLGLIVLISTAVLFAGDKKSKSKHPDSNASAVAQIDDDKRIVHALNRFTFGVRPATWNACVPRGWTNGSTNSFIRTRLMTVPWNRGWRPSGR